MTILEIREFLGQFFDVVELSGDGDAVITGPAKIEEARSGEVSFVANEKYVRFLAATGASLVIVKRSMQVEAYACQRSFLLVDDPYLAFVMLLQVFSPPARVVSPGVAPTASIGEDVSLGEGVSVGAYAVIGNRCSIGRNVVIAPHVVLLDEVVVGDGSVLWPSVVCYPGVVIGRGVTIHAGAVIGSDGFGFAPHRDGHYVKIPQIGTVGIGDDAEIGANTTIDRATMGSTLIGAGVKVDNLVQIAHNCVIGDHTVIASQAGISGSVRLGRHCLIGGQAGFAGHLELADRTQVAAQAGVSKSFSQEGLSLRGYPAQPMRDQLKHEAALRGLGALKERLERLELELAELKGR